MVQIVKEFPDVHLQNPASPTVHELVSERVQRQVCRSSGPETIRAVQKVVLIDWLQQHDDRPLKNFVFQRRNPERTGLGTRAAFRNVHSPHGRSVVRSRLRAVEQDLQVPLQILFVLLRGHSIHAHGTILAGAPVRFLQPVHIHQLGQRSERHLWRLFRQLCYPLLFRGHAGRISMHSSCFSRAGP